MILEGVLLQTVEITDSNKGVSILAEVANSFFSRFCGLMGRASIEENHGLLLLNTDSIHMMFMRFPIDVIYFDADWKIVKIVKNLRPWIGLSSCFKAKHVLELKSGECARLGLVENIKMELSQEV